MKSMQVAKLKKKKKYYSCQRKEQIHSNIKSKMTFLTWAQTQQNSVILEKLPVCV